MSNTEAYLSRLLCSAIAAFNALPPEEQRAMMEAQRQSWVRGEQGLRETKAECAMSEPITRADLRAFLLHKEQVDALYPNTSPALIFDSWCSEQQSKSASPQRAPVSSIDNAQQRGHLRKCEECQGTGTITVWGAIIKSWSCPKCEGTGNVPVGVESGPGQPIKALDAIRAAMIAVERVGADPRLTDAVNFLHHAQMRLQHFQSGAYLEPLNVVISAAELTRLREQVGALEHEAANMANRRVELEDSERLAERRAGIEAAAQVAANAYSSCENSKNPTDRAEYNAARFIERAIRALADKPAPDALLPLMQAVIEAARRMPRETPAPGGSHTKHTFVIEAGEVWDLDRALTRLDAEISARGRLT